MDVFCLFCNKSFVMLGFLLSSVLDYRVLVVSWMFCSFVTRVS